MAEPELLRRIREELKRTVRLLLEQLRRDHPADRPYAVLFDVDVSETYAIRVAGTEESLTRLAEKYVGKGYQIRSGDLLDTLRALLRWDAPGDDRDGWYWGDQHDDIPVTQMIEQAVQAGLIHEYDESRPLRRLCLDALRELDRESVFGVDVEREKILIGVSCCEDGFGEEKHLEELAALNPTKTITRLQNELRAAVAADEVLIRPKK